MLPTLFFFQNSKILQTFQNCKIILVIHGIKILILIDQRNYQVENTRLHRDDHDNIDD